jgi:hypothetical protein
MMQLRLVKRVVDAVAEAEAEISRLAEVEDKAKADTQRLGQEWLFAESQAVAEQVDRARIEAERVLARCAAVRPELEQRLAAAKAEKQREGLARHHAAIKAFLPTFIASVEGAAQAQVQAILLRNAAVAELSESLVQANIPSVAFLGLLVPDLVEIWATELRRSFEPPSAKPAPVARTAANGHATPALPPTPTPKRALRADPPPQTEDHRSVVFVRPYVDLEDGTGAVLIGDQRTLPADVAHRQVLLGNGEFAREQKEIKE